MKDRMYISVEHDDGKIHAIDLTEISNDISLWRNTPVCGTATGVSSDEYGPESIGDDTQISCWECKSIIG